jgi:UDP-glucuronate 4-epimerase
MESEELERSLGKKAELDLLPMQSGDVPATYADVEDIVRAFDFRPSTSIKEGISRYVTWYRSYYK